MTGSLVISLDFELMWGVCDHRSPAEYGDAILGGRGAIPQILDRFSAAGIRATWATVGLLFAKTRQEMLDFAPTLRPQYENTALSPYGLLDRDKIGADEASDPLHFGRSLVDRIGDTPGQEIATHTYSHFYCMEPGADIPAFQADLEAAKAIASHAGHAPRSIVFPRNQMSGAYVAAAADLGIDTFRGSAEGWLYRPRSGQETTPAFRLARFIDGALPLGPDQLVQASAEGDAWNIPASRFLRPWSKKLSAYHALHIRRIEREMELAARAGACYHLWWHPHNFGRNTAGNLRQLDRIIDRFKRCRDEHGMTSRSMGDFAEHADGGHNR